MTYVSVKRLYSPPPVKTPEDPIFWNPGGTTENTTKNYERSQANDHVMLKKKNSFDVTINKILLFFFTIDAVSFLHINKDHIL